MSCFLSSESWGFHRILLQFEEIAPCFGNLAPKSWKDTRLFVSNEMSVGSHSKIFALATTSSFFPLSTDLEIMRACWRLVLSLLALVHAAHRHCVQGAPDSHASNVVNAYQFEAEDLNDMDVDFELDLSAASSTMWPKDRLRYESTKAATVEEQAVEDSTIERTAPPPYEQDEEFVPPSRTPFELNLTPKGFNFGRGVGYVTTKLLQEGDVLFSMPLHDVMSLETARQSRINIMLEANPDLPASIAMALHLMEQKCLGSASRFALLIDALPSAAAINSTIFYSDHELDQLKGSHLYRVTMGRRDAISTFFDALVKPVTSLAVDPPLFSKDDFTLEEFTWALGVVWSHSFPYGPGESEVVLAPVLDTIGICDREDCPPSNMEFDLATHRFTVYAPQGYAAGEEVRLNLGGSKPSVLLMLNHGFARAEPSKLVDQLDISIFLDPNDTMIDVKQFLLASVNMSMNDTYTLRYGSEALDDRMAVSLKIKLLAGEDLSKYKQALLGPIEDGKTSRRRIVSLRNEFVYTRAIVIATKNLLAQHTTTLEADLEALNALRDSPATRRVQILRSLAMEKQILHNTLKLAMADWSALLLSDHPNLLDTKA